MLFFRIILNKNQGFQVSQTYAHSKKYAQNHFYIFLCRVNIKLTLYLTGISYAYR